MDTSLTKKNAARTQSKSTQAVNSIRARLEHVTTGLKANRLDVLSLRELKGTEFPANVFTELGYESAAVTQKGYNGVAVLSRTPIETISTALAGDGDDTHARFLEMTIQGIRMVLATSTPFDRSIRVIVESSPSGTAFAWPLNTIAGFASTTSCWGGYQAHCLCK